jgi:hypothetical protein
MLTILKQPYPFLHKGKNLIKVTMLIFVIGFLFEYFIIPFQRTPDEHKFSYEIISLFHVGVATIIYFLFFAVVSQFVDEDDWKLYKEVLILALLLFFIGLGEWMIRDVIYYHPNNWAFSIMVEEIWHAYLSGTVIIILVLTINYNILLRQNLAQLVAMHLPPQRPQDLAQLHLIETQTKSDDFQLDISTLLCVRADGNYADFYIKEGEEVRRLTKRITIQRTMDQLTNHPHVVKTHRAYIVNAHLVGKVEGNAQGFQLYVAGVPFTIPVSRKHMADFNKAMEQA